jgi:hypothetical protein
MRDATEFVNDMLYQKRTALQILAVARNIRKGVWYEDARKILIEKNLLTEIDIENARVETVNRLRESWKAQRIAWIEREKFDKQMRENREKAKQEKAKKEKEKMNESTIE